MPILFYRFFYVILLFMFYQCNKFNIFKYSLPENWDHFGIEYTMEVVISRNEWIVLFKIA